LAVTRHILPEEVLSAPEPFAEAGALAHIPAAPFAFIWMLIRRHFAMRVSLMVLCALVATSFNAMTPYIVSHLVNAIGAAVKHDGLKALNTVTPWIAILAAMWFGGACSYRAYEMVDVGTGPRMRGLAQKYLFSYLLGHSPRYFQDNFAGKLGQKVNRRARP
jgi:ATP-binding cassette subfamily B protein